MMIILFQRKSSASAVQNTRFNPSFENLSNPPPPRSCPPRVCSLRQESLRKVIPQNIHHGLRSTLSAGGNEIYLES